MKMNINLIKTLLVLVSILLAVFLVVELISLNRLSNLRGGANLEGELAQVAYYPEEPYAYSGECPKGSYMVPVTSISEIPVDRPECAYLLNQEDCEAKEQCLWKVLPRWGGFCYAKPILTCKESETNTKCVQCTLPTVRKDCGEGKSCCAGKCYDPTTEACCGNGAACSAIYSREGEVCINSGPGSICLVPGENTLCSTKEDIPEGAKEIMCDQYNYCIFENLTIQAEKDARTLCNSVKSNPGESIFFENLLRIPISRTSYTAKNNVICEVSTAPNSLRASAYSITNGHWGASIDLGVTWLFKYVFKQNSEELDLGKKRVDMVVRADGGGRTRTDPVYVDVHGTRYWLDRLEDEIVYTPEIGGSLRTLEEIYPDGVFKTRAGIYSDFDHLGIMGGLGYETHNGRFNVHAEGRWMDGDYGIKIDLKSLF